MAQQNPILATAMYKRSDWKQGSDLPKSDPITPKVITVLKAKTAPNSPAIKSRTKVKIKWGADSGASKIAHNMGDKSRCFPVAIPGYRGLFVAEDRGIWFQYRDRRDRFPVATWHHAQLKRVKSCPIEVYMALQKSNVYLFHGKTAIAQTIVDSQLIEQSPNSVKIPKTPNYKVGIGVAAHAQNMGDWQREARSAARLLKHDIKQAARALPEQRIARRNAIAVIDEKDMLAARAKRRAATLVKK